MPQTQLAVQRRPKDHAAAFQSILGNEGEDAAGGGVLADNIVLVPRSEDRRKGTALLCPESGAYGRTAPAADTFFGIDGGIGEALPVPLHRDCALRAYGGAGGAAGTGRVGGKLR
ncbi:hypothetical protein SDC9_90612 [bioreactor metagenome]|uniref:Uncharacterized protein n=1 Tax=bioreactor metagenome TaxID=1076179 RepID=A0A645A2A8_9ZZZZ